MTLFGKAHYLMFEVRGSLLGFRDIFVKFVFFNGRLSLGFFSSTLNISLVFPELVELVNSGFPVKKLCRE